jgi:hypothetical protein
MMGHGDEDENFVGTISEFFVVLFIQCDLRLMMNQRLRILVLTTPKRPRRAIRLPFKHHYDSLISSLCPARIQASHEKG